MENGKWKMNGAFCLRLLTVYFACLCFFGQSAAFQGHNYIPPAVHAACSGKIDRMKASLERGDDINAVPWYDLTPLMHAARKGDLKMCEFLLENGANMRYVSKIGDSAMTLAISNQRMPVVQLLLDKGVKLTDIRIPVPNGPTQVKSPLLSARDLDMCRFLVEHGGRIEQRNEDDEALLIYFSSQSDLAMLEYFLAFNPDILTNQKQKNIGLEAAFDAGKYESCRFWLGQGTSPDIRLHDGRTPLMQLVYVFEEELDEHHDPYTFEYSSAGERRAVLLSRLLLDCGADIQREDEKLGLSMVHYLQQRNGGSFLTRFFELRTDVFLKNRRPDEFLMAAYHGDTDACKEFLKIGKNIHIKDEHGETSLHYAIRGGHTDLCQFLLEQGAEIGAKAFYGGTPLHYAMCFDAPEIAALLVENGADCVAQDEDGITPIQWALCDKAIFREIVVNDEVP